jgi:HrpA-like RNA helicase
LAKVLFSAARGEENCVAEVIDIIACLSVSNANAIFSTSEPGKREEGTELRSHFASPLGDLITLLRAFREFLSVANHGVGVKEWCRKWEINWRAAKNAMVRSYPSSVLDTGADWEGNPETAHFVL